jgi:hypothetical protein
LILPFGLADDKFDSTLGMLFNGLGIPGGIFFCLIIMKMQQTKNTIIVLKRASILSITMTLISFLGFILATLNTNKFLISTAISFIGFFSSPICFIGYELLVGLTPKIGEAMSCGLLNSLFNLSSFLTVATVTPFLQQKTKINAIIIMSSLGLSLLIALFLIWLVK